MMNTESYKLLITINKVDISIIVIILIMGMVTKMLDYISKKTQKITNDKLANNECLIRTYKYNEPRNL